MEVLKLHINVTGGNTVKAAKGQVNMVMFDGWCEGVFNGKIMAGGVDTQVYPPEDSGKPGTLSARYMLEGTDPSGTACKMFIENNGVFGKDGVTTIPQIYTDSENLRYLESAELYGTLEGQENGVLITIFTVH